MTTNITRQHIEAAAKDIVAQDMASDSFNVGGAIQRTMSKWFGCFQGEQYRVTKNELVKEIERRRGSAQWRLENFGNE